MNANSAVLALFGNFGWQEIFFLAVLGVLIFGRRLPEVGRSLGKSIVEFKKGLSGIEDEVQKSIDQDKNQTARLEKTDTTSTSTNTASTTTTGTRSKQA
ncbi:MAG: twin-arginine translocase TatA/TatE family subunit [Phycisphaeraceae bacterium]|nr:twin-arginine translocase TatA/TatE family subunit [Phycisphaeraceae bacterium]